MNKQDLNKVFKQVIDSLTLKDYEDLIIKTGGIIKSKSNSKWILHTFCHHKNALDGKPKLEFYINSKLFYCYTKCCQSYNIVTLLQQRFKILGEEKNRVQILKYIIDTCELNIDLENVEIKEKSNDICDWQKILSKYTRYKNSYNELKPYDKSILNGFPKLYHKDWLDYGITEETMEKYNIRYYPYRNQIVIPCYNKGGYLIGIRVRNMDKIALNDGCAKYFPLETLDGSMFKFQTNFVFYGENYNLEEIKRTGVCWLVESEKSVLKFDSWFHENNVSLGLYGSNLGKKRFEFLIKLGLSELVIMLDSDFHTIYDENNELTEDYIEFEDKVLKMAKPFKPYIGKISVCFNNQGYEGYKFSPCDFTREQFDMLYKNREEVI